MHKNYHNLQLRNLITKLLTLFTTLRVRKLIFLNIQVKLNWYIAFILNRRLKYECPPQLCYMMTIIKCIKFWLCKAKYGSTIRRPPLLYLEARDICFLPSRVSSTTAFSVAFTTKGVGAVVSLIFRLYPFSSHYYFSDVPF